MPAMMEVPPMIAKQVAEESAAQAENVVHQFTPEETAEIDRLTGVTDEAERSYLDLAEQAKNAKKYYESHVDRLRAYIRDCRTPGLFNVEKPAEDWRGELLSGFVVDARALNALSNAELFNLGELTDFLGDGKKTLRDIKGIGESAAKSIEDALERFWAGRTPTAEGEAN